jgi:putative Mg2+ transporter-C (MgtC) family protein
VTDLVHLVVAVVLAYVLGFEREVRGASAGVRVFSMIGLGSGLIGILSTHGAPNALAGVVTGVGFIGGGLVFRQVVDRHELIRGLTTAGAILAVAALGATAGEGHLLLAGAGTFLAIFLLELHYIKALRFLSPHHYAHFFSDEISDEEPRPAPRHGQG